MVVSCSRNPATPPTGPAEVKELPGLHNVLIVGDNLRSGSGPEGEEGFHSVRDLGVTTILSVDGARPDVEMARKYGLRYVHVPLGYDGISREQALQLARAAETPGSIYVHCHHGKHRGPTAAALMQRCRGAGWSADDAVAFLARAGTDQRYEGLYAAAREFQPPDAAELRQTPSKLPESVDVGGLTAIMVAIDEHWDVLNRIKANDWKATLPAQSAAHSAVQLAEHYREAARLPDSHRRGEAFQKLLAHSEQAARDLEKAIRESDGKSASAAFDLFAGLCTNCHRDHRDRRK